MNKINIYPVDTNIIESNVASENFDVSNNNNFRARGLPALDYLLHGVAEQPGGHFRSLQWSRWSEIHKLF